MGMFSFRHKEAFEIVKILYDDIGCVFWLYGIILLPISTWLAAQHYKITPWVYPFISNSVFLQMVIVGGTLFLFSDAPFFDETQLLLIIRMNRVQWCMAQMIYICVSTMVYFAAIALFQFFYSFLILHLVHGGERLYWRFREEKPIWKMWWVLANISPKACHRSARMCYACFFVDGKRLSGRNSVFL